MNIVSKLINCIGSKWCLINHWLIKYYLTFKKLIDIEWKVYEFIYQFFKFFY